MLGNPGKAWALELAQPWFPLNLDTLYYRELRLVKAPLPLDINRADYNELTAIPAISPSVALKIIRHRPYRQPEDLRQIPSVPANELERVIAVLARRALFAPTLRQ